MKDVTVTDLRYNFPKVELLLREGKEIRITKRGKTFTILIPENPAVAVRP